MRRTISIDGRYLPWKWRAVRFMGQLAVLLTLSLGSPHISPAQAQTTYDPGLPAPDYAQPNAWLAYPGRNGLERSTPPGFQAIDENAARADVFYIHPTTDTQLVSTSLNVAYDEPDSLATLNPVVLLGQASVFNGCCRIYAPQYRQATLVGLQNQDAVELAYSDVARAFTHFLQQNNGRPFIIASHSQGTLLAVMLFKRVIAGTPLQNRLIAGYLIGGYVPQQTMNALGVATCDAPQQINCFLGYNSAKPWALTARIVVTHQPITDPSNSACVNPLTWRSNGWANGETNAGSLPPPQAPYPSQATTLPPLLVGVNDVNCNAEMLDVNIPSPSYSQYQDQLATLLGSYHTSDYFLFYANLRQNALDRTAAWVKAHP